MDKLDSLLEELICPVCLNYCNDAMNCIECHKLFCKECIFINHKFIKCPLCRKSSNYIESLLAKRLLGNISFEQCPYGCKSDFKRGNLNSHLFLCENRIYKCKICNSEFKKIEFLQHLLESHMNKLIEDYDDKYTIIINEKIISDIVDINEVKKIDCDILNSVKYINFYTSGNYFNNGKMAGTNEIQDLLDDNLTSGICAKSPGYIIIEFDKVYNIKKIKVAGWDGDKYLWSYKNGQGAFIYTSLDKNQWIEVGILSFKLNNNKPEINEIELLNTNAKFIKFEHKGFIGLGYLHVLSSE